MPVLLNKFPASNQMNTTSKIAKIVRKYFSGTSGCHDWEHTERVFNLCIHIGKKEKANIAVLKLAALLHDIGRKYQDKTAGKICHAEKSSQLAKKILKKNKINKDIIHEVLHCIETHRYRGKKIPQTLEAKILFDADKLDSIGAVGIGRSFLFAGEVGAKLHDKDIEIAKTKSYSKEDTAYREFLVKLQYIKTRIFTKEGKRIAKKRHKYMVDFFERLNNEVDGKL